MDWLWNILNGQQGAQPPQPPSPSMPMAPNDPSFGPQTATGADRMMGTEQPWGMGQDMDWAKIGKGLSGMGAAMRPGQQPPPPGPGPMMQRGGPQGPSPYSAMIAQLMQRAQQGQPQRPRMFGAQPTGQAPMGLF